MLTNVLRVQKDVMATAELERTHVSSNWRRKCSLNTRNRNEQLQVPAGRPKKRVAADEDGGFRVISLILPAP